MKSFFDFIGRTEATRGARRWSWTILEVNINYISLTLDIGSSNLAFAAFKTKPIF
ncbi:hypothetical protein [Bacillus sp. ISL-37]|uniref:hypothetical protein n=1 Tax=Bacillus sp. ISL-37 TaxID=2819123 RepID=UPI001BE5564D|nr:hypothetical protein [Bacillus sp. ISL-37]